MEEGICPAMAAMPLASPPSPPPSNSSALQEASAKRPPPPAPPRPPRSSLTQSSSPLPSENNGNYPFRRSNSNSSCSFPSAAAAAAALRTGASSSSSSPSSYSASSSSRLSRSYQGFPTSASSSYRDAKRDSGGNHSFGGGAAAGGLVRTGYTPAFKPNSSSHSPSPPSSFSPSLFSSASARAPSSTPPPRPPRNAGRPFHASTVSVPYAPSSSPPPSFSSSEVVSRSRSLGDENEIYQREEQNEQPACNNNNSIAIEDKKKALQAAGFLPAGGLPAAFAPVPSSASSSSPLSSSSGGKEKEKEKGKEKKKLWQTLRPRLGSSSEETNVDDEQQQVEEKDKKKKKQKSRREKKSKDKEDLAISMPSGGAFSLPFTPTPELSKHNNIKNNKRPSTSPPRTQQHGTLRGLRQEKEGTGAQLSPNVVATLRRPRGRGPNHQRPKSMGSFIRANASSGVAVVGGSPPSSASTRTRPTSPLASVSATASAPSPLSLSSSSVPTSADINNSSSPASSPSTPSFSPSSFTPSLSSPSPKPQQLHRASLPAPVASFLSVQQQQQQQPSEGEEPSVYSRSLSSSSGNNLHLEDSNNNNNLTARRTQQRSNCQELLQQEEARRKNSLEKKTPPTPPPRFPSVSSSYSSTVPSYSENGEENEETITTMTANEAVQKNLATAPVTPFYYYSSPQDANAEEEEEEEEEICSIWEEDLTDTTTILFSLVSEQGSAVEADPLYTEPVPATASVALADGRREVKAATFNRLIAVLTSDKGVDPAFVKTFLLTYQSFCTPEKLLMKLQERYNVPADFHREEQKPKRVLEASSNNHSNGAESAAEAATETSKDGEEAEIESKLQAQVRKSIQLRVCNVVKKWIEGYYEYDFSPIMRTNLMKWIEREIRPNSDIHATTLLSSLKKVISGETKRKTVPLSEPPEPILPKKDINFSTASLYRAIIRTSPLELARQQCLIEMSIFEKIRPPELLNQAWNKKKSQAPNVLSSIQYFNYFSRGVAATIVHTEVLRKRIKLYTHFVQMAYHLRKLNNFNSLMAVLAGLNSSPVHRLKHTRQGIPQRWKETYEELEQLMASKHAFKWYRETLRFAELPALPYLGVHLSDLTFIDENPNFIVGENGTKLINMKKRKLVYTVISKLQTFQDVPYHLVPVEFIQDLLRALPNSEDKELYELSLVREPRDAERADLL